MALRLNEIRIIEKAISKGAMIRFQYFPNTNPAGMVTGFRYAYPLRLFTKGSKKYMLAFFIRGASLSKSKVLYRLYIQKNLYDITPVTLSGREIKNFNKVSDAEIFKLTMTAQEDL